MSKTHRWLKPTGPAIGLVPEATYKSETLKFEDGDMMVMYTDGLVEAEMEKRQNLVRIGWLNTRQPTLQNRRKHL